MEDWSQSITVPLCHSFLLTLFPFSSMGSSPRLQSFTKYLTAPSWGFPWAAVCIFAPEWPSMICREITAPLWSSPGTEKECLLWHLEHLLPLLLLWAWCPQDMPPSWLSGSSVRCGELVGAGWNWLCPASGSPSLSSHKMPMQAPCYQHLDTSTQ